MGGVVCIAVGNQMRGDDGVAHHVLDLLGPIDGVRMIRAHQLTPEMAEEIGDARIAIVIDADLNPGVARLERINVEARHGSPFGHVMSAVELVVLAKTLFGFNGAAFLCHVPGVYFEPAATLSSQARANAERAAELIHGCLISETQRCGSGLTSTSFS